MMIRSLFLLVFILGMVVISSASVINVTDKHIDAASQSYWFGSVETNTSNIYLINSQGSLNRTLTAINALQLDTSVNVTIKDNMITSINGTPV